MVTGFADQKNVMDSLEPWGRHSQRSRRFFFSLLMLGLEVCERNLKIHYDKEAGLLSRLVSLMFPALSDRKLRRAESPSNKIKSLSTFVNQYEPFSTLVYQIERRKVFIWGLQIK